jgi:hypothetical protein
VPDFVPTDRHGKAVCAGSVPASTLLGEALILA